MISARARELLGGRAAQSQGPNDDQGLHRTLLEYLRTAANRLVFTPVRREALNNFLDVNHDRYFYRKDQECLSTCVGICKDTYAHLR
jgi:hypothetical protein